MRYVLCIFLPPIAVLTTGRVGAFFLCILLCLLGWIPGLIYAILVVNKYYADERHKELMQMHAMNNRGGINVNVNPGYYQQQGQYQNPQQPYPGQHPQQEYAGQHQQQPNSGQYPHQPPPPSNGQ